MPRLIDADALVEYMDSRVVDLREMYGDYYHYTDGFDDALQVVEDAPTIDAVEVVRCKDCIHDNTADCHLCWIENHTLQFINHDAEFFCGKGERRSDV